MWRIEQDALIIPRGAYVLQPNGNVERNRTFEGKRKSRINAGFVLVPDRIGLTATESGKLSNYFHFREPIGLSQKSLTQREALDRSVHFLDTIDEDIPKGSISSLFEKDLILSFQGWSVQFERGSGLVQIRSLKWLGMAFFHIPETNRYGSLYCGIGEENKDLPFML